ncbi:Molybdopterin binding protein, partial [Rhizoclosmatium globosum]
MAATTTAKPANRIAVCIIGDEVLGGKTKDTNSHFVAKLCFAAGLSLKRVVVIPDDEADIVRTVRELSHDYSHVITSGGIGPTHDDITYDAIAKAFNADLVRHEETITRMVRIGQARTPDVPFELNPGRIRMAMLPSPSKVSFPCSDLWVPVVSTGEKQNVHIFPGVPRLFQQLVTRFVEDTIVPNTPGLKKFIRKQVATIKMESEIMATLTKWQEKADADGKGTRVGSYPKYTPVKMKDALTGEEQDARVVISVVGTDDAEIDIVLRGIQSELGAFEVAEEEAKL